MAERLDIVVYQAREGKGHGVEQKEEARQVPGAKELSHQIHSSCAIIDYDYPGASGHSYVGQTHWFHCLLTP
jgi:hypothetical protein